MASFDAVFASLHAVSAGFDEAFEAMAELDQVEDFLDAGQLLMLQEARRRVDQVLSELAGVVDDVLDPSDDFDFEETHA